MFSWSYTDKLQNLVLHEGLMGILMRNNHIASDWLVGESGENTP